MTVVAGVPVGHLAAVVDGLLARADRLAVLSYRVIRDDGLVRGVRDSDGRHASQPLPTEKHCPSCAMLADSSGMLRLLAGSGRYDAIVLHLAGGWELDLALAALGGAGPGHALRGLARIDTVVTVADAPSLLGDLSGPDLLADRALGLTGHDRRTLAPVLARQLAAADVVLLLDCSDRGHPGAVLIDRLAPHATLLLHGPYDVPLPAILSTGRFRPARTGVFADSGPLDPLRPAIVERDGIVTVRFDARRPFHPARLHAVLGELAEEALRGSGRLWLATRPDCVVRFDLAGGTVILEPVARWLEAPDGEAAAHAGAAQRSTAQRIWDPYYGDRAQHLAFTGLGLDPDRVTALLHSCLLTDAELALGPQGWRALPDPITAAAGQPPTGTVPETSSTSDPETGEAP